MEKSQTSFTQSVISGIKGYFKGLVAGGVVGAITGGLIGAVAAIAIGPAAIATGALLGGALFASIGSIAGTTTEVVKSREAGRIETQDVANAVNIAFAQGVSVGHERTLANPQQAARESAHFRQMVDQRRAEAEQHKTR